MYHLEEEDRSTMERKPKLLLVMGLLVGNLFFSSDHLGSHWSTLEPLHIHKYTLLHLLSCYTTGKEWSHSYKWKRIPHTGWLRFDINL